MAEESVVRSGRKTGFTVLTNTVLKDKGLTLKTKGLFAIMMSLPDDWSYNIPGLCTVTGVGKSAVRAALQELQEAGYLKRMQGHGPDGTFGASEYVLCDEPETPSSENRTTVEEAPDAPLSGFPQTDNPSSEKPSSGNRTLQSKHIPKKDKQTPIAPKEVMDRITEYTAGNSVLEDALLDLLDNRAKANHRPVKTLRAVNGILRDLDEHSGGSVPLKIRLLENAIKKNWLTVYQLKPDELPQQRETRPGGGRCL